MLGSSDLYEFHALTYDGPSEINDKCGTAVILETLVLTKVQTQNNNCESFQPQSLISLIGVIMPRHHD